MEFFLDCFIVVFMITWLIMMSWFLIWVWLYLICHYFEHRVEVHARMQERFARTTNRGLYEYHARQLKKNVNRLNWWLRLFDYF